jgi:hypothetical protein
MAAIELTISGVLFDKTQRTQQPVVLIGEATYRGLSIDASPPLPETPPDSGNVPAHPIFNPDHPAHPIVIVPPTEPPTDPDQKFQLVPVWSEDAGWSVVIAPVGDDVLLPTPSV